MQHNSISNFEYLLLACRIEAITVVALQYFYKRLPYHEHCASQALSRRRGSLVAATTRLFPLEN